MDYLPGVPCSIQEQGMEGETMTIESGLDAFAEYGHDLALLGFRDMKEAGLLNEKGISQYEMMKDIEYSQLKPEIQISIKAKIVDPYLSIIKEAMRDEQ